MPRITNTTQEVIKLANNGMFEIDIARQLNVSRQRVNKILKTNNVISVRKETTKWTEREQALELLVKGVCDIDIAGAIGVHPKTVYLWRKEWQVAKSSRAKRSKYAAEIKEYAAEGLTVGQVAKRLGVASAIVSKVKKQFGITFMVDGRNNQNKKRVA
jgi:DNA-binding NarL/FixJ family response regulator